MTRRSAAFVHKVRNCKVGTVGCGQVSVEFDHSKWWGNIYFFVIRDDSTRWTHTGQAEERLEMVDAIHADDLDGRRAELEAVCGSPVHLLSGATSSGVAELMDDTARVIARVRTDAS